MKRKNVLSSYAKSIFSWSIARVRLSRAKEIWRALFRHFGAAVVETVKIRHWNQFRASPSSHCRWWAELE